MPVSTIRFPGTRAKGASPAALRLARAGMERDGALVLDGLFPRPLLGRIRREVLRRHKTGELRERGLVRDIGGRYAALLPFQGPFLEPAFYANPGLLDLIGALLGASYCIGSLEAVIAEPGSLAQHQHIDGPLRFDRVVGGRAKPFRGDLSGLPPYALGLAVPLCDVDDSNGPTEIWAGSHRAALRARLPGEAEVRRGFPAARMVGGFGRAYLFDYRVFHRGLPNLSREPRPLLMLVFTRSWFRDPNLSEVFPRVVIGARALRRVPERHRPLFQLAPAARRPLWPPTR